jgi:long-subunit acyl-CoA synthetase (AMP-forming)
MREVTIGYGMTETSPLTTQTATDDPIEERGHGGPRPSPCRGEDRRPAGETLPIGQQGEYCARGYAVMPGYWDDPEKTAEAIDGDGWMHSGDLATMDAQGYVRITGRIKDMIIRGGENIYPREIEEFLLSHPAIADAQVFGVADAKFGEGLRVDHRQAGRNAGRARCDRALQGPHRALQGAALRPHRQRLRDDRYRQGAEVRDAQGDGSGIVASRLNAHRRNANRLNACSFARQS